MHPSLSQSGLFTGVATRFKFVEIESSTFDPLLQARKSKVCEAWGGVAAFVEQQEKKIKRAKAKGNPAGETAMN